MTNMDKCGIRCVSKATGANQIRDVASGIAQHRHVHRVQTDTEPLATLCEPAYSPEPMHRLHRVPKREPLWYGEGSQRRY